MSEQVQHGKQTELEIELESFLSSFKEEKNVNRKTMREALKTIDGELEMGNDYIFTEEG
jgi:hypothetical protein